MERVRAALAGAAVFALVFGGATLVRTVTRLAWAVTRLLETVALLGLAAVLGYLVYRVLAGAADDPRHIDPDSE
jgi:membrane protein implicated in regulation of membrane protease activity